MEKGTFRMRECSVQSKRVVCTCHRRARRKRQGRSRRRATSAQADSFVNESQQIARESDVDGRHEGLGRSCL